MRRGLTLALIALCGLPQAAAAAGGHVIADGHVDLGPRVTADGRWTLALRDDSGERPAWRSLDETVLHARDTARLRVPDDPRFAFLGTPGDAVWVLPQVQRPGVVWPGWNTQAPGVGRRAPRGVTWRLTGVRGPGRFVLFSTTGFGPPDVLFDSARDLPQEVAIEPETHAHGNWAFTRPGRYRLEVEMATKRPAEPVSAAGALHVFAGPGDPLATLEEARSGGAAFPAAAAGAAGLLAVATAVALAVRRRRRSR